MYTVTENVITVKSALFQTRLVENANSPTATANGDMLSGNTHQQQVRHRPFKIQVQPQDDHDSRSVDNRPGFEPTMVLSLNHNSRRAPLDSALPQATMRLARTLTHETLILHAIQWAAQARYPL